MTGIQVLSLGVNVAGEQDVFYIGTTSGAAAVSTYTRFATTTDDEGNFYVAGNELPGGSGYACVLIKANAQGTVQWVRNFRNSVYTSSSSTAVVSIGVDPVDGAVYAVWASPVGTGSSHITPIVSKYDASGTHQWTSQTFAASSAPGGASNTNVQNIGFDSSNIYLTGVFNQNTTILFAGTVALSKSTGAVVSGKSLAYRPSSNDVYGYNLIVDGTTVYSSYRFGGPLTYSGAKSGFATHNLSTNTASSTFALGGNANGMNVYLNNIQVDSSGNRYLFGWFAPAAATSYQAFAVKLNSSNVVQWAKRTTNTLDYLSTAPNSITESYGAVDSSGNIYWAINVGEVSGGTVASPSRRTNSIVVAKLDSSGNTVFANSVVISGDIFPTISHFKLTAAGNISLGLAGQILMNVSSSVTQIYSQQAFVFVLPKDGSTTGSYSIGGQNVAYNNTAQMVSFGNWTTYYVESPPSLSTTSISQTGLNGSTQRANNTTLTSSNTLVDATPSYSSVLFSMPGTFCWPAPSGVSSVSAVVVGGGSAALGYDTGGGGGALAYKNNIAVTAGNFYTVAVGKGGAPQSTSSCYAKGGQSYFINTSTVAASPAASGINGGVVTAGTGGSGGGSGGLRGGGGAGGYAGNGGLGGYACSVGSAGSGGAAGGGGGGTLAVYCCLYYYFSAASGGGVGVYGQGSSGGTSASKESGGFGGSGGSNGQISCPSQGSGGSFGGGGGPGWICGCAPAPLYNAWGRGGAVRIVWPGNTRSFPSTNVGADS